MKIIVDFNYGGKEEFECDTYSIDEERGVLQLRTDKETVGMIMLNTIKYWKVEDKQEWQVEKLKILESC